MTEVQHNMNALNSYNRLNANVAGLRKASEKLSSGYRINRAGDDAAGLAISEKMRSQIKGLNQAIRNSQDGINMVQTFEGAAQETHSILQRMKELATQSANGTYDNATDRAAIQLEFDQLNDELNQIADTDFNGTVVLNGGVMADGTVAKNGEFNYANGYTETVVGELATDISKDEEHMIVDQTYYNKDVADAVYDAVKVDVADAAGASGDAKVNVTFMYDGERWVADTVTYGQNVTDKDGNVLHNKGDVIEGARAAGLEARPVERTDASGKGGFEVVAGKDPLTGKDIIAANAIFNEMTPVKKGDTVTVQFDNTSKSTYAPKNIGFDECFDGTTHAIKSSAPNALLAADLQDKFTVELDSGVTDSAMTQEVSDALEYLDKATFKVAYANGVAGDLTIVDPADKTGMSTGAKALAAADFTVDGDTIKYTKNGADIALLKITKENIKTLQSPADPTTSVKSFKKADGTTAVDSYTLKDAKAFAEFLETKGVISTAAGKKGAPNGAAVDVTISYDGTKFTVAANGGDNTTAVDITAAELQANGFAYDNAAGKVLPDNGANMVVTYTPEKLAGSVDKTGATGDATFGVNIDAFNFVPLDGLSVHAVETPKVATMASQVAENGVTQANAFKNSTARMTYTDNITLQTGARTKDAVNFSFSYNQDGTADMGDLVANLDLSARSTGLNTANLSLANQDDANYAIDQIDKAINKTSMVRATFGSIQNRLEHKITNLTTTSENLTEAESSIRDTDMASEMMNYTKFNILQQAAQSMLAQANQQPQSILQLLG